MCHKALSDLRKVYRDTESTFHDTLHMFRSFLRECHSLKNIQVGFKSVGTSRNTTNGQREREREKLRNRLLTIESSLMGPEGREEVGGEQVMGIEEGTSTW